MIGLVLVAMLQSPATASEYDPSVDTYMNCVIRNLGPKFALAKPDLSEEERVSTLDGATANCGTERERALHNLDVSFKAATPEVKAGLGGLTGAKTLQIADDSLRKVVLQTKLPWPDLNAPDPMKEEGRAPNQ